MDWWENRSFLDCKKIFMIDMRYFLCCTNFIRKIYNRIMVAINSNIYEENVVSYFNSTFLKILRFRDLNLIWKFIKYVLCMMNQLWSRHIQSWVLNEKILSFLFGLFLYGWHHENIPNRIFNILSIISSLIQFLLISGYFNNSI